MVWVFEREQLERALAAYAVAQQQQGATTQRTDADAFQIRAFLNSPEALKLIVQGKAHG